MDSWNLIVEAVRAAAGQATIPVMWNKRPLPLRAEARKPLKVAPLPRGIADTDATIEPMASAFNCIVTLRA